jgi:periplasmic protein TonB
MLETLLESNSKASRSIAGAITSVVAHTALIAAAVYATAQAHPERPKPPETVRPVYIPRATTPTRVTSATTPRQTRPLARRLIFVAPNLSALSLSIDVPPIDAAGIVAGPGDFPPTSVGADIPDAGGGVGIGAVDAPFRAEEVEKQVSLVPGAAPPRYPELLRSSGVEGQVIALFIVDEHGRSEEESIRFVRSDNRLFEDAVRVALRRMRFVPAEVGGRRVRQLVQMPFVFTLAR